MKTSLQGATSDTQSELFWLRILAFMVWGLVVVVSVYADTRKYLMPGVVIMSSVLAGQLLLHVKALVPRQPKIGAEATRLNLNV